MAIKKELERIKYLNFLIRNQLTGTPEQLAEKLKMSKRYVHQIIKDLNELGANISYDSNKQSYRYSLNDDFIDCYFKVK